MSQAPFSKSDVDTMIGGSHAFKKHVNVNKLARGKQPGSKVKYFFGIVAVALLLLLLGSQLAACGNATPSTGSASSTTTSNSSPKADPNRETTSGSDAKHTADPPKTIHEPDPRSFTVREREFVFTNSGSPDESSHQHITLKNSSNQPLKWSVSVTPESARSWLHLSTSSGTLIGSTTIDVGASNSKANLTPGSHVAYLVWSPVNPGADNTVKVTLTVYPPEAFMHVSNISPASGPAEGGTRVTITGFDFTYAQDVFFGSTKADSFTVDSDTQITAVSPAGSGTVDVIVKTPNSTSAAGTADQFTYT